MKKRRRHLKYFFYIIRDAIARFFRVIFRTLFISISISITISLIYAINFVKDLNIPEIDFNNLGNFAESTIITDRNGEELFTFFTEDRRYIPLTDISKNMLDAIIATEDQSFRKNPGIDMRGIARASRHNFQQRKSGESGLQGASTITQQLIKNIALTPERTITRKVQEMILSLQLNDSITQQLQKEYPDLEYETQQRKTKEKILELYLNYIFLGNQAYGIEAASQRYFGIHAAELNMTQSAILAAIPKAPSHYNAYTKRNNLMGYWIRKKGDNMKEVSNTQEHTKTIKQLIRKNTSLMQKNDIAQIIEKQGVLEFLHQIASISTIKEKEIHDIYYIPGRKDHVLGRLYQQKYINERELIDAFIESIGYKFKQINFPIKAPHFVFYVKDFLTQNEQFKRLGITEKTISQGGYTITTSLDRKTQQLTQNAVENNMYLLQYHSGTNRSVLYTDTTNGDILSYVGSINFRNKEIQGQNDMIRAKRQIGSTMKPFIYSFLMKQYPLGPDTRMKDSKITLQNYTPQNADGRYKGYMSMKKALAGSRNITAIKAFLATGGEKIVKSFLQQIGMHSLQENRFYGFSLALGAAEMQMLELNQAYFHLSQDNNIPSINPILSIKDKKGNIIYQKQPSFDIKHIPNGVSRLIRDILSEKINAPRGWDSRLSMPNIKNYAIKTGTSNIRQKEKRIPRDARIVFYNASRVISIRAGNTNGRAMKEEAYGGTLNAPLLQDLVKSLHENGKLPDEAKIKPESEIAFDDGSEFYRFRNNNYAPNRVLNTIGNR